MRRSNLQYSAIKRRAGRLKSEERLIRRVRGSAISEDGATAIVQLETATTTMSLRFSEADLPSLFAAAASAYERCRRAAAA